jgi:hypothetical protein
VGDGNTHLTFAGGGIPCQVIALGNVKVGWSLTFLIILSLMETATAQPRQPWGW